MLTIVGTALCLLSSPMVYAAAPAPDNPQSGSMGVTGTLPSAPPQTAPTITSPTNGQSFTSIPISVSGLCSGDLLIKVFSNNVFLGSTVCTNGSYRVQIDLFSGQNDLVARAFDSLDQASPDSNIVRVTFNDQQFNPTGGQLLNLTSDYARRGANPGDLLTWPIILSGGVGPYAISVNWGDGKPDDLISRQFPGTIDLQHTYDNAGQYSIVIKATDSQGLTAYLQVVGVANGAITQSTDGKEGSEIITVEKVMWLPTLIMPPLILLSFWLGKRYALSSLRKKLEQTNY